MSALDRRVRTALYAELKNGALPTINAADMLAQSLTDSATNDAETDEQAASALDVIAERIKRAAWALRREAP